MALATLSIDLEARLAGLQEGFDKAARLAKQNADASAAAWQKAGAIIAGIGASAAGAFAGFSVVEFVRRNTDAIDALNDVADATGASIENISALEDLARRTGTSLEVATTSLIKLNAALSEAKPDSPAALALKGIGLEVAKLKSLDPAEALRQVAVALSGYADDGEKARLVQELFGKSLREVAPFLNDLAEKTSLVATTTSEQAKQAEKFNKELFALQANSANLARALTSELLPALNSIFDSVKRNGGVWAAFMDGARVRFNISAAQNAQVNLALAMRQLEAGLAIPENKRTMWQNARIQDLRDEIAGLMRDAAEASEALKTLGNGGKPVLPKTRSELEAEARRADKATYEKSSVVIPEKSATAKKEEISEAQRALASYVTELQKELDKTEQLSEQQKALNLLKSLGTLGEVPQVRELVLGMERQLTLAKQDNAIRADNLRIAKEQEAIERDLNDTIFKLSGRADESRKIALTQKLEEQLNSGVEYSSAELERIVKGIAGITDDTKDKLTELDELTKQFARNVQDALGDTLLATIRGDYDSILSLWGNLLVKMASEAAAAELGKALFGNLFAKTGDGAGQLGGLFGNLWERAVNSMPFTLAAGGVVDEGGIQRFAVGGVFDRATRFSYAGGRHIGELGEAGPEAILPLRRGPDGRLGVAASGQAGPTVIFQIASGVTRGELASMVPQLTARVKAELQMSARRPGGGV